MIPEFSVTPAIITAIAGVLVSLAFSWIPGLNTWFAKFQTGQKQLIMVGVLLVTTAVIFAMGCFKLVILNGFTCSEQTALEFFWMFVSAAVANQTTFNLTPTPKAVAIAKSLRVPQLK